MLTTDFRTMYNLQLAGGDSTQYINRYCQGIDVGGARPQDLPEVLAVYDTH